MVLLVFLELCYSAHGYIGSDLQGNPQTMQWETY